MVHDYPRSFNRNTAFNTRLVKPFVGFVGQLHWILLARSNVAEIGEADQKAITEVIKKKGVAEERRKW